MKFLDRFFEPETCEPEPERTWWTLRLPDEVIFTVRASEEEIREALEYGDAVLIENDAGVRRFVSGRQVLYAEPKSEP